MSKLVNQRPAVVVTDIALKGSNGLELVKNLMALVPGQRILAMSMHDERVYAERAIRAGARGYIMKGEAAENFLPAIRTVLRGDIYLSEWMKKNLLSGFLKQTAGAPAVFPMDTLSDREMEVFQLLGDGFATREIAQKLHLSTKTIDSYREHLKLKLNLENSAELLRYAIRWARFEVPVKANPWHRLPLYPSQCLNLRGLGRRLTLWGTRDSPEFSATRLRRRFALTPGPKAPERYAPRADDNGVAGGRGLSLGERRMII